MAVEELLLAMADSMSSVVVVVKASDLCCVCTKTASKLIFVWSKHAAYNKLMHGYNKLINRMSVTYDTLAYRIAGKFGEFGESSAIRQN